jgi:chemotaxis protein CheC
MKKGEWAELNSIQIDVLKEIGNIGAGNAATALAKLLNKKIDMTVPKIRIMEFNEVNTILGEEEMLVVGILLTMNGDISGDIMFIIEKEAAELLVCLLMDKDRENFEFGEMEISALKEIGNILTGSYLSALTALSGLNIQPSIPQLSIDMAGAILSVPAIEFGKMGETVLYIETEFNEGDDKVIGDFFLIPDINSFGTLLKALGVSI